MLNLEKSLSNSKYNFRKAAGELDYDLQCQAEEIYERFFSRNIDQIENNTDETLYLCLDETLVYYNDQWSILKAYCTPMEANWDNAINKFIDDLMSSLEFVYYEE